jgi:hypothetical protein
MPDKSRIPGMLVLGRNTDLGKKFSQKRFWARHTQIWERIWEPSENTIKVADSQENKEVVMKKKGYKGRCEKRSLSKCVGICRTYEMVIFFLHTR